ncbi:hypothetical protein GOBAR_AA34004 [Gossypium barbadense]|uniref:Endonuclease/exonuclease/phosphatase domain-containing protein n=1 Tax=Gossypium barbadense TaxID=3634 RepID=A0A2P5W6F3_GOSBA|nr:hypothetical protein GOBAR_AA34004 [Gossypium barbadense]
MSSGSTLTNFFSSLGGGDIEANRGCLGHCPRPFHAQTSVPPIVENNATSHPGPSPSESSRSPLLEQEPPAPWNLGRVGASGTFGNLGCRWYENISTLLLGRIGALDAIGNLGRRWYESLEQHRHLGAQMCGSLEQHRQLGASDVREPQAASVPWCLRCAGASNTIGKLGHWFEQHRHLGAWMYGSLEDHRHLGAWMSESLGAIGTIGNLGPWSCESLGPSALPAPRPLVVREPRAPLAPWCLDVWEPRAQSAPGRARALGTIGNLGLDHARASGTIGTLEPWAPSAPWCLGCAEASSSIGTLVLGCARASDTIGNLGSKMCGCLEQQGHPGAADVRAKEKCPRFRHTNIAWFVSWGVPLVFPLGAGRPLVGAVSACFLVPWAVTFVFLARALNPWIGGLAFRRVQLLLSGVLSVNFWMRAHSVLSRGSGGRLISPFKDGGMSRGRFGGKERWAGIDTDPSSRQQACDMLRRVNDKVNEGWIVVGGFNAILNDSEKEGGHRKPKILMEDLCTTLEELKLTDVKPCNGWFMWTNNREGDRLVKERLEKFVVSDATMEQLPFLTSFIIRQSKSDHEAIMMDSEGSKPNKARAGQMVWFRYDTCWADEQELKDIISSIWSKEDCSMLDKMDLTRDKLSPWQYQRFRRMKNKIKRVEEEISQLMDGGLKEWTMRQLKQARGKLGHLYDVEEKYWALRARNWHDDEEEIGHIVWDYFNDLFKTSCKLDVDRDLQHIPRCIDEDTNRRLSDAFTDEEIMQAFKQMDP